MRRKLAPLVGLVVTCALLIYVFKQVDFHRVVVELKASAAWTAPAIVAVVLLVYVADSVATWKTFGWFAAQLSLREVLVVRGATYLLGLVNYALGQGAIVYFIRRSRGVPVSRSSATVLLMMGINVLALLAFASLGSALSGAPDRALRTLLILGYAGLAFYLLVIRLRPAFLTRVPVLQVLFQAGAIGHLKAFAIRLPHITALLLLHWTALRGFGVKVPLLHAVMYLPVTFLAALVPSFLGLGPMQASMVALMSTYSPNGPSAIAAASFTCWVVTLCVQVAIALVCLRSQLTRGLSQEAAAAT